VANGEGASKESGTNALDVGATSALAAKGGAGDFVSSFEQLLCDVQGLRPLFIATVDFCRIPRKAAEVDDLYNQLTEYNHSVFSAVRVRALLEEVDALAYIEPESDANRANIDGACVSADSQDGGEGEEGFLEVTVRPEGMWLATQKALEYTSRIDPFVQLRQVIRKEEPRFAAIFRRVLAALESQPSSIDDLDEILSDEPIMQQSPRSASHYVKKLEECGAVEYRGQWVLTEVGRKMLADETMWL
jgi:hypothetical protein